MSVRESNWLLIGSITGFFGVFFGAFGAHVLEDRLSEDRFNTFETAVEYQLYHALVLIIIGFYLINGGKQELMETQYQTTIIQNAGLAITSGIILFSGSLYCYVIFDVSAFVIFTPMGGIAFLIGWYYLIRSALLLKSD
ncbi:MAG: DUF423 domain-containing protein [Candidatus Kariarchaeaceae archaeon]|jgi:uncharacterized membrane protein YgdD (TMEM256/DUF423 family)